MGTMRGTLHSKVFDSIVTAAHDLILTQPSANVNGLVWRFPAFSSMIADAPGSAARRPDARVPGAWIFIHVHSSCSCRTAAGEPHHWRRSCASRSSL